MGMITLRPSLELGQTGHLKVKQMNEWHTNLHSIHRLEHWNLSKLVSIVDGMCENVDEHNGLSFDC